MKHIFHSSPCTLRTFKIFAVLVIMYAINVGAVSVNAAVISFDPQDTTVGTVSPFLIGLTIDSDVPINTIKGVIDVPSSMEILDASDGNSVINMWIERPHITDAHQLVFSGIIPGGFSGYHGRLLTLNVQAKQLGSATFIVNPSSKVYENSIDAAPREIISQPLTLRVVEGKDNVPNIIPDTTPPEVFVPTLVAMPDGSTASWAVSFETQDKISGVASYQVAESPRKIDITKSARVSRLSWHDASSPYILSDQQLSSYVYVKAVDFRGNERIAFVAPQHPRTWYIRTIGYILVLLLVFIALYALNKRVHISIR